MRRNIPHLTIILTTALVNMSQSLLTSRPRCVTPLLFAATTVHTSRVVRTAASATSATSSEMYDAEYPGTAVVRLQNVLKRVSTLTYENLSGDWENVRRNLLWAGGLRDLPNAIPGQGYTGHSFNDYNHVDLTTMNDQVSDNENDGSVS